MAHERKLLAGGIAAIIAVAAAPYLREAWREHRLREAEARSAVFLRLMQREIACLERLRATGLPAGIDVEAEIEKCRRLASDPATGDMVKEAVSAP